MSKTLEHILDGIDDRVSDSLLSETFPSVSLENFSDKKTLFDFQQTALRNALKALHLFYVECQEDKGNFFDAYESENITLTDYWTSNYFNGCEEDFPQDSLKKGKISFANFCNRMSFWMATGSGKTLVIIKLIEILDALMKANKLPNKDILFLAHRPDIMKQFEKLVCEFNAYSAVKIKLINLREFDTTKNEKVSMLSDVINVFWYRSDLISDSRKANIIDFREYDNNGDWFILLDEAHKGTTSEISKRQTFYSILSRKGFMFNFSATFTEANDNATCAFNFNLDKFIDKGYGKQIYVSNQDAEGFKNKTDFSHIDKQKIALKTLILHTYIKEYVQEIRSKTKIDLYHMPLLMGLVNSVNPKKDTDIRKQAPDLEMLFNELDKVANNKFDKEIFAEAQKELVDEMKGASYSFDDKTQIPISDGFLGRISYRQVLKAVFNAEKPGNIEAIRIRGNNKEIIFKLQSTTEPFALIRIGDISSWFKNILEGKKEIGDNWEGGSEFNKLNSPESKINILMGSRSFYEGWDSNRPNIILFVNIGTGYDSKKFVMQSIGRGVRIEPLKDKRRRIMQLIREQTIGKEEVIDKKLYDIVRGYVHAPECLFIFGTNAANLIKIIEYVKQEKSEGSSRPVDMGGLFVENTLSSNVQDKAQLLIPKYKDSGNLLVEEQALVKFPISEKDLDLSQEFISAIGDKVATIIYGCSPKVWSGIKKTFKDTAKYYTTEEGTPTLNKPIVTTDRIIKYFSSQAKEHESFQPLKDEIKHHTKISFVGPDDIYDTLKDRIEIMANHPERDEALKKAIDENAMSYEEIKKAAANLDNADSLREGNLDIKIRHLANHYYNPLLTSADKKQGYLKNIIQVPSEVEFIDKLVDMVPQLDEKFKWWMFSKLNENWDEVYIPYYNIDRKNISNFHPDFIFWLKEKDSSNMNILFVDPKGTKHSDYQHKADWHSRIYGKPGEEKEFQEMDKTVKVYLRFFTNDRNKVADLGAKEFWIDNVQDITNIGKG